jgi:hypothetical protein
MWAQACAVSLLSAVALLTGCSGGKIPVDVGAISFTDVNGNPAAKPAALNAGAPIYADVQLNNDKMLLGVDWTVACGSAPPPGSPLPPGVTQDDSCGIFTPVHTATAPVPSYAASGAGVVTLFTAPATPPKEGVVTLYAAATADHSRYSSVTLTVVGLPISIQFGSVPVSTVPVDGVASFKAVLTNDYVSGGVEWSATCGASSCGSFSPAKTATGVATTYTAPSSVPAGGTVVISATSATDPTKSISTSVTVEPIAVTIAASSSSVAAGTTDLVSATVSNDVSNAGADWSLSCTSPDACGSIDAHTSSGVAASYTAPDAIPGSGKVTITATSSDDKTAFASTDIAITASPAVTGTVMSGQRPVRSATVFLYATGSRGYGSEAKLLNNLNGVTTTTDDSGRFSITGTGACPFPSSLLYVVARGGNAGGGENPNLAFVSSVGPCSRPHGVQAEVVNEVTTVASAYALSRFMQDGEHVGAPLENAGGIVLAEGTIDDLVNRATGRARAQTKSGSGNSPNTRINALANFLHRCAATGGGRAGDGSPCGELFSIAGGSATKDTLRAVRYIARHANGAELPNDLNRLTQRAGPFEPAIGQHEADWRLTLEFPYSEPGAAQSPEKPSTDQWSDAAGNRWVVNRQSRSLTEVVGAPAAGDEEQASTATAQHDQ